MQGCHDLKLGIPAELMTTAPENKTDAGASHNRVITITREEFCKLASEAATNVLPEANRALCSTLRFECRSEFAQSNQIQAQLSAGLVFAKAGDSENHYGCLPFSINADHLLTPLEEIDDSAAAIRDFASQPARWAQICDIVIWAAHHIHLDEAFAVAHELASKRPSRRTYFVNDPIYTNGGYVSLRSLELIHSRTHTAASQVLPGIWVGTSHDARNNLNEGRWTNTVRCIDGPAPLPSLSVLNSAFQASGNFRLEIQMPGYGMLPSPLPVTSVTIILNLCRLLWKQWTKNGGEILIFSEDGYRSSTLIAILLGVYVTGETLASIAVKFWRLRPLMLAASDVKVALQMEPLLLHWAAQRFESVLRIIDLAEVSGFVDIMQKKRSFSSHDPESCEDPINPLWLRNFDGNFPCRIMDLLYIGPLHVADNQDLLRTLGIRRILSVGEPVSWISEATSKIDRLTVDGFEVLFISRLADDGIDGLDEASVLRPCFNFFDEAYARSESTLVHCRMGVSRSAAICIAEVMRRSCQSLPQAYSQVRARRLNFIIQPNLRLMYDLLRFEECISRRTMEWPVLCHQIAGINSDL